MKTLLALALLATFVVQAATPRAAAETGGVMPPDIQRQPGAPYVPEALDSGDGIQDGFSSEGSAVPALRSASTPPPLPAAALPSTGAPVSVPARYSASATWCAPTPTQCQSWGGNAKLAAVFSFTEGDAPYWVTVSRGDRHVDVLVVSHCACLGTVHAIDLSPSAFERLAPLSRGRIDVTVSSSDGPALPATDTPDQHPDDPPTHPDDDRMRDEVRGDTLYQGGTE